MEAATPGGDHANGARVGAAVIDFLVLFVVFVVYGVAFGDSKASGGTVGVHVGGLAFVGYLVVVVLYFAIPEGVAGASLGKRLVGLRVTRDDGSPIGFGRSLVRNVLRLIDALPFFYLVGLVAMLIRSDSKRVGDIAAGTIVRRPPG